MTILYVFYSIMYCLIFLQPSVIMLKLVNKLFHIIFLEYFYRTIYIFFGVLIVLMSPAILQSMIAKQLIPNIFTHKNINLTII